ncbi:MAG: hypothetical protein ACFFAS_02675 [Promethearchaeota archaeon]
MVIAGSYGNEMPFITNYSQRSHIRLGEDIIQEFNISTSFSPSTPLTYGWQMNGTLEASSSNSFIFDTNTRLDGVYRIKINVTDGTHVLYHYWPVLVSNTVEGL